MTRKPAERLKLHSAKYRSARLGVYMIAESLCNNEMERRILIDAMHKTEIELLQKENPNGKDMIQKLYTIVIDAMNSPIFNNKEIFDTLFRDLFD